jgi:hypothetical protein
MRSNLGADAASSTKRSYGVSPKVRVGLAFGSLAGMTKVLRHMYVLGV